MHTPICSHKPSYTKNVHAHGSWYMFLIDLWYHKKFDMKTLMMMMILLSGIMTIKNVGLKKQK